MKNITALLMKTHVFETLTRSPWQIDLVFKDNGKIAD